VPLAKARHACLSATTLPPRGPTYITNQSQPTRRSIGSVPPGRAGWLAVIARALADGDPARAADLAREAIGLADPLNLLMPRDVLADLVLALWEAGLRDQADDIVRAACAGSRQVG
jgi:hypothetical protein